MMPAENGAAQDRLRLLVESGLALARERKPELIAQCVVDAAKTLTAATFVVFFRQHSSESGEAVYSTCLAGLPENTFAGVAVPAVAVDAEVFRTLTTPAPKFRSFFSLPVSNDGGSFGTLVFGHLEESAFPDNLKLLASSLAAQASAALESARLSELLRREISIADSARSAQRDSAERLERVFDAMTEGVALMDRNWVFTYLNRAGEGVVGARKSVVGKPYLDVFPDAMGSNFHKKYQKAMNGDVVEFTDYYAPFDLWAHVRVFPFSDGIAIFFQDVTRQRKAETALAESTRRLRQALEAAQLGTWTWDRETDMLDMDERCASFFGIEAHVPVSRTQLRERLVSPEDRQIPREELRRSLESGETYHAEYRILGPDGKSSGRWLAARGIATFTPGTPEIAGMIGTMQDITDRKTQEATLRQSEKLAATGRLAATIAHEINNPLEAVTNLIYLCKTDPTVPAPIARMLETADSEIERVSTIAQQTLGFYRDNSRPAEVDLNGLLEGVVGLFSRKLTQKKLTCQLDLPAGLRVFGLQGELRQVFSNLLVNAIDASTSGGIRIRGRRCHSGDREGIAILLSDSGSGIPVEIQSSLFSPFFTTKEAIGTGLGLWVTRGIVERMGGTILFRTRTGTPSGTCFRVFIPAEPANPQFFYSPSSTRIQ